MTAAQVLESLERLGLHLAVAESLTGGLVAAEFTSVPGASKVFLGSVTAYQTQLKHQLLGVSAHLLANQGAVDPEVSAQMAGGVRTKLARACELDESVVVGVSTTGVAGPPQQDGKPVGTVFIGLSGLPSVGDAVYAHQFEGTREQIREQTVEAVLTHLAEHFLN